MGGATAASDRRPRAWLPVLVVAGAILVGSALPLSGSAGPPFGPVGLVGDVALLHAVGYGLLGWVLARALVATGRSTVAVLALVVVATVGFGLAVELLQVPLPTRGYQVADLLADGIGAVAAVSVLLLAGRLGRGPLAAAGPRRADRAR